MTDITEDFKSGIKEDVFKAGLDLLLPTDLECRSPNFLIQSQFT